ncbi:phosphoribosylanthranilate isomerase [Sphingomonas abietis]|uniref:N-(5'-phosphoribosyl)anthranilate isomerase n=1 Tax=Sphingomonas abietis TaxID=3012344 RepID=A0ABY7NI68_9SPHN|nr:phosphoribosylanthranilate isomerase [Sphingomonas abietis]WBO21204.1 phosphoribosylanthranilate isomerase [Sphingomonas abietis]
MPTFAKICGLSTPETVSAATRGGASHVGFVFFPKSPRDIVPEQAGELVTPEAVGRIGVFVDPDDALLLHAVRGARLTGVQLHGDESPERVAAVKARLGIEVWKAVPVRTRADLDAAKLYRGAADRILYDAKTPKGTLPGGMGLRFDWKLLEGFGHPLPWALSGGLDVANIAEAVRITGTRLVDVSSGVERAPGVKDVDKIAAFLQATAQS